ncbi:MAG: phosphoribosylglycinamide formyltransferase [Cyanobacteriota bacterium]|nr:phosphoribosylglycinamide formyltransferase [Cyanobacteriota bacterium]
MNSSSPVPPVTQYPRLAILASGSGTNFEAVAQAINEQKLMAEIAVMITNNPQAKVIERAEGRGIPWILLDHRHFPEREMLDQAIVEVCRSHAVDWIIMAGWMRRVTSVLIDAFPQKILNIHPSLLPSFPGIRAIEQALAYGVKITGCTVHFVTLEVDQGPIIAQAAVPVFATDTPEILHQRIQPEEHRILVEAIQLCLSSRV